MGKQTSRDNKRITLVLLPGLDGTGELFEPVVSALPSDVHPHVIAYPQNKSLFLSEYAQFVAGELPKNRPVILLAESFSGLVALTLLAQRSVDIDAVIFCAAFAEPPRPLLLRFASLMPWAGILLRSVPAFMLRQFCLGTDATTEQLTLLRKVLMKVPPNALAYRLKLISSRHSFLHLRFKTPCYYLQAENDRLVPPNATHWFTEHFDSCQLREIKGPHFLMQAKPKECAEAVAQIARNVLQRLVK